MKMGPPEEKGGAHPMQEPYIWSHDSPRPSPDDPRGGHRTMWGDSGEAGAELPREAPGPGPKSRAR